MIKENSLVEITVIYPSEYNKETQSYTEIEKIFIGLFKGENIRYLKLLDKITNKEIYITWDKIVTIREV